MERARSNTLRQVSSLLSFQAAAFRRHHNKESAMKSLIHAAVMAGAILAAVVMTTPLYAQIDEPLTFTTDFSFIVNGKTMPASGRGSRLRVGSLRSPASSNVPTV